MGQLGYRTTEEMLIVAWTAILQWLSRSQWFPCLCELMTNGRLISGLGAVVLVVVTLSQILPYTRFGKRNPSQDPAPDNPAPHGLSETVSNMTLMGGLRVLLGLTLPLFGTMLSLRPGTVGGLCLLKKMLMLEQRMWSRWCPSAYFVLISIVLTLCVARRSSFSQRFCRQDRFKGQSHAHFSNPDP